MPRTATIDPVRILRTPAEPAQPSDATAVGAFMAAVVAKLGVLGPLATLELPEDGRPLRLVLETTADRRYALTIPEGNGPFELWACAEVPIDDELQCYARLREREEVLAQALRTTRLAWHVHDGSGWIGLPIALAASSDELDTELATATAESLSRLLSVIERICVSLAERAAARARRRTTHGRHLLVSRTATATQATPAIPE